MTGIKRIRIDELGNRALTYVIAVGLYGEEQIYLANPVYGVGTRIGVGDGYGFFRPTKDLLDFFHIFNLDIHLEPVLTIMHRDHGFKWTDSSSDRIDLSFLHKACVALAEVILLGNEVDVDDVLQSLIDEDNNKELI